MPFGRPGRPNSVAWASTDVSTIVTAVTSANASACSRPAKRHQRRQRARFASVTGNTTARADAVAVGSPVTGLTRRGRCAPMPKPLSRIQLLWHRFWPPPAPAKAMAPSRSATSRSGRRPACVTAEPSAAQLPAPTASASASRKKPPMTISLTMTRRSSAV